MTNQSSLMVVYDGECPFCSNYVRLMALRETVGRVERVNARQSHPLVRDLQTAGYNLNEGMAVIFGGKIYYGSEAVTLLSRLSDTSSVNARALSALLRDPARSPGSIRGCASKPDAEGTRPDEDRRPKVRIAVIGQTGDDRACCFRRSERTGRFPDPAQCRRGPSGVAVSTPCPSCGRIVSTTAAQE